MAEEEVIDSSDSDRHARELAHARYVTFDGPHHLESGGELPSVTVAFETYGQLNPAGDNAVLVCHAISGDSHVARHDATDDPGWWDIAIGPGKAIDTDRYFVICPNILGGCRGTTGPNSYNPKTGSAYGPDFPMITTGDIINVQKQLVDHLGIDRLLAVVGGSLGGHMALAWAIHYPHMMAGTAAIATSPRLTSQALAFDVVGRNAILHDPHYNEGRYYEQEPGPLVGLAIARMLGHITYLSRESMKQKFDADRLSPRDVATQFETRFSVGSYLAHQGDRFGQRFDPNSYITLSMAMDLFDLGATHDDLVKAFEPAVCRWLVVSFTSDWLFPDFQSRQIVDALLANNSAVSYCNVESSCGHDAFLLPNELDSYGTMIAGFLENLNGGPGTVEASDDGEGRARKPTSIFHDPGRLDYESIAELIPPGASVLDLGCGTGGLLSLLKQRGHQRIMGIELDEHAAVACVRHGLDVLQSDLNQGLSSFSDGQFDFVVLSQTLQTVIDVRRVVNEMLRVGRRGIVSFPNLGYHKLRRQLAEEGRAPLVAVGGGTRWHDTQNVRFLTIADFDEFCREEGIQIHQHVALDTEAGRTVDDDPNLNADMAIVVLSK
ncbi:MAG: homoserine O-acetyltransferase [Planctomycetes bacterium]|nr:homoserine O-acetyltransferase [Planctomycetota bacterium]MBL7042761.1 homoserine O-acetyltransferase [Pirellulaceae bacterium]